MNPREKFKERLILEREIMLSGCEGQHFIPHNCTSAFHMHEAIYSKKHFMKAKGKDREYFELDERNLAILCSGFHMRYGHTRAFKEWWLSYAEVYGDIMDYINGAKKYLRILN